MIIVTPAKSGYCVAVYGARNGKAFTSWHSRVMSYSRAVSLRLRIARALRRGVEKAAQQSVATTAQALCLHHIDDCPACEEQRDVAAMARQAAPAGDAPFL